MQLKQRKITKVKMRLNSSRSKMTKEPRCIDRRSQSKKIRLLKKLRLKKSRTSRKTKLPILLKSMARKMLTMRKKSMSRRTMNLLRRMKMRNMLLPLKMDLMLLC
jgi:hypothetical protein